MATGRIQIDPDNLLTMVRQIQTTAGQFQSEMNRQVKAVEALPNFEGAAADAYRTCMGEAGKSFQGVVNSINDLANRLQKLGDGMLSTDQALARIAGGGGTDVRL